MAIVNGHGLLVIERILRDRDGIWQQVVAERDLKEFTTQMLASSAVSLACYGAVLGSSHSLAQALSSAIKLARSGLRAPDKPIGSFLFAGPTGVGKTELARQLARVLKVEFIRFDMSEYMEKHAVARLIGAPPGYVGYEDGGLLIDAIRKTPHAVLLLDEIEKAHPDLFAILLQVMDHATLTDTHGRQAATSVAEALDQLGDSVAVYLDAGPGSDAVPSTIVDLSGQTPRILREGRISRAELAAVVPALADDKASDTPSAPGTEDR